MKTKLLIFFLLMAGFFCSPQKASAQFVVHDPVTMEANLIQWGENVSQWVKQIQAMLDAQFIREGLQKINQLKQLKSLVELAQFMDDLACLSADYRFYLNLGQNYHCLKFLNYQKVSVNLNFSLDMLFKVATVADFFSMNSEGRIAFIAQVREAAEQAAEDMKEYNEMVRSQVVSEAIAKHNQRTYYSAPLAGFTRYSR